MIIASLPETPSLPEQVQSLLATGECIRNEVAELRLEDAALRQQVQRIDGFHDSTAEDGP